MLIYGAYRVLYEQKFLIWVFIYLKKEQQKTILAY